MFGRRRRILLEQNQLSEPILEVHAGRFEVVPGGIRATMRTPMGKLSGNYPWMAVPLGIAAMKLLIVGGGDSGESVSRLIQRFDINPDQLDLFDEAIGVVWKPPVVMPPRVIDDEILVCERLFNTITQTATTEISTKPHAQLELGLGSVLETKNPWVQSANRLIDWGHSIQEVCPYRPVAYDLGHLRELDNSQLEQYVLERI